MHLEFVKYGSPTCEIWNDVAEGHLWSMNFRIVNCETMKPRAELWTYETDKVICNLMKMCLLCLVNFMLIMSTHGNDVTVTIRTLLITRQGNYVNI